MQAVMQTQNKQKVEKKHISNNIEEDKTLI